MIKRHGQRRHRNMTRAPRYIRRMIQSTSVCRYQREEYATSAQRNDRWHQLTGKVSGLVRYSDINSTGLMVYVIAWTRANVEIGNDPVPGTPANRETAGATALDVSGNSPKMGIDVISMENVELDTGNLGKSRIESISMETGVSQ